MICLTSKFQVGSSNNGCRKLEDFRKPGEENISEVILQTRYDFFHNKRFYKLSQIYE